eukprot:1484919-Amphidinium_carterae.1
MVAARWAEHIKMLLERNKNEQATSKLNVVVPKEKCKPWVCRKEESSDFYVAWASHSQVRLSTFCQYRVLFTLRVPF